MLDDQRPTLTLTYPQPAPTPPLTRILVGMHDYGGLDPEQLPGRRDFPVDGVAAGQNLASRFRPISQGVWELKLAAPLTVARASSRCP